MTNKIKLQTTTSGPIHQVKQFSPNCNITNEDNFIDNLLGITNYDYIGAEVSEDIAETINEFYGIADYDS